LLEGARTRNRDFALSCEETVEDENCLWKGKEKEEETSATDLADELGSKPHKKKGITQKSYASKFRVHPRKSAA
jgi:hypothetical protein